MEKVHNKKQRQSLTWETNGWGREQRQRKRTENWNKQNKLGWVRENERIEQRDATNDANNNKQREKIELW